MTGSGSIEGASVPGALSEVVGLGGLKIGFVGRGPIAGGIGPIGAGAGTMLGVPMDGVRRYCGASVAGVPYIGMLPRPRGSIGSGLIGAGARPYIPKFPVMPPKYPTPAIGFGRLP